MAACAIDAGIRPLVSALLLVPNLAQPDEALAVTAARAVIDPICANPAASVQANTLLVLNQNIGTITGILTTLQTRKTALTTPKTGLSLYALHVWPRAWQT